MLRRIWASLTICAAAGALLLLGGAAAVPGQPIPRRDPQWHHFVLGWARDGVVFFRYRNPLKDESTLEIAIASTDGRRRLAIGGGGDDCASEASVNPVGRQIAYPDTDNYDEGVCDIYIVNTDGSGVRNLTKTGGTVGEFAPAWSPDGTAIAYERRIVDADHENWNHDLVVAELAGGSSRVVGRGRGASWSPDGRRLLFSRGISARKAALFSVGRDGTATRRLTPDYGSVASGWSPDGRWLLFERDVESVRSTVWLMRADGTGKRRLTVGRSARWSPQGDWIAFTRGWSGLYGAPGGTRLFVIRPTGGRARLISRLWASFHAWAPDGRRLAFSAQRGCLRAGVVITGVRGKTRMLTNDCRIYGTPRADVISGTEELDRVWGFDGSDRIDANPRNILKEGWGGDADVVRAGAGADVIRTGPGADTIFGGPGDDRMNGDSWSDKLFGDAGNDVLRGGTRPDRIDGGLGRDSVFGGEGDDVLLMRDGDIDRVSCGPGSGDQAVVDHVDRVAADCENVLRR